MTVRLYEWDKTETGWAWIEITDNKVVNLKLRDENNLIKINEDDEAYVDLQLEDWITPSDDFPVGVTTGRVLEANGWIATGTITISKTTSGDYTAYLYGDDGKVYVDNGTGEWKILQQEMHAGEWIEIWSKTYDDYSAMRWPCDEGFHVPNVDECNFILRASYPYTQTPGAIIKAPSNWYIKFNNGNYDVWFTMRTRVDQGLNQDEAYLFSYDASGEQHIQPLVIRPKSIWAWVRWFADTPVEADGTWTVLHDGIRWTFYWNETLWLISVYSKETERWITLQDKNVWAENVGDYWLYFQRWNNYWFTSASEATSSERVDASWYAPSTYNEPPINTSGDWSSVRNPDLWGWVTWIQQIIVDNVITNTWVLSVNWQTGNVTVDTTPIVPVWDTLPSSPVEWTIFFNTTDRKLNIYDGTDWNEIQATQVQ